MTRDERVWHYQNLLIVGYILLAMPLLSCFDLDWETENVYDKCKVIHESAPIEQRCSE